MLLWLRVSAIFSETKQWKKLKPLRMHKCFLFLSFNIKEATERSGQMLHWRGSLPHRFSVSSLGNFATICVTRTLRTLAHDAGTTSVKCGCWSSSYLSPNPVSCHKSGQTPLRLKQGQFPHKCSRRTLRVPAPREGWGEGLATSWGGKRKGTGNQTGVKIEEDWTLKGRGWIFISQLPGPRKALCKHFNKWFVRKE